MVPRLLAAMGQGDDATLREVLAIFEESGFALKGVAEIAPHLVPGPGIYAGTIGPQDEKDAARAEAIVAALGAVDVGQACVVAGGLCLAVEALPGTDAMLGFVAQIPAALRPVKGLVYKAPKPTQDRRIDLPALGVQTIRNAAAAGLGGLCWQAGGVICLDLPACQAEAEALGLLYLIAGEPSGDRLGAALMAGLKALSPGVEFHGIGGPLMQAEGMVSLFPMEELSIM
eukprot:gene8134-10036_t